MRFVAAVTRRRTAAAAQRTALERTDSEVARTTAALRKASVVAAQTAAVDILAAPMVGGTVRCPASRPFAAAVACTGVRHQRCFASFETRAVESVVQPGRWHQHRHWEGGWKPIPYQ